MPDPSRRRIVVFGDVIDDIVVVPRGPIRVDTDTRSSIRKRAGGSAANAAAWMGVLGGVVDFVGVVGVDDVARHSILLERAGVSPHLTGDPELPTGTIVVIVEGERRTMLTETGANTTMIPDAVGEDLLASAALLHFTGYSLFGPGKLAAGERLLRRCRATGVQVSVDPGSAGFIADLGVERFLDAVDGATLIFPNLEEGRVLTGLTDQRAIVEALLDRFEIVALTLDTAGVVVGRRGHPLVEVAAVDTEIVDPTGAGDAFAAGFLTEWVRSSDVVRAARSGVSAGARAVATIGARPV
ncbi:MAG TPA: PfkB family carbohydrate kinase [Lacisediminihabitans sp.]|uniref:carbohydrate kinase family protein n=1 Tax=Lacisediminihabitans sp. TaxID=2787631 RepID=UPI002EDAC885